MYLENNQVHRYPVRAIFAWMITVLWMAVIFLLSHQTGEESGLLSQNIMESIYKLLGITATPETLTAGESLIRNIAHGTSFFILAMLTSRAFAQVNVQNLGNALLTFCFSALYAGSDELHQAFVPGRACQLSDFLIDTAGVILAIIIYQTIATIRFVRAELEVKREEDLRI